VFFRDLKTLLNFTTTTGLRARPDNMKSSIAFM